MIKLLFWIYSINVPLNLLLLHFFFFFLPFFYIPFTSKSIIMMLTFTNFNLKNVTSKISSSFKKCKRLHRFNKSTNSIIKNLNSPKLSRRFKTTSKLKIITISKHFSFCFNVKLTNIIL